MIFSSQSDVAGTKQANGEIASVADAAMLRSLLRLALSESVVVEKTRLVNLIAQTWAHLDALRGIGGFLELEVVLQEGRSPTEAHAITSDLMQRLGIKETDLISAAYANMLIERAVVASATPDPPPARSSVPRPHANRQGARPDRSLPASLPAYSLARLLACRGGNITINRMASAQAQSVAGCLNHDEA